MRPYHAFFMPDMWNDWHWFIVDARNKIVTQSDRSFFHLIDAQREAERIMLYSMAS